MKEIENAIIYEDNHIIAINKKSSQLVQGDSTGDTPLSELVKSYIKTKYNKPGNVYIGVTHRIDRPVSGVVLFAKTSKALTRLNKMFAEKTIKKNYIAIVDNTNIEDSARLIDYLYRDRHKNKSFVVRETKNGAKESILSYQTIKRQREFRLLKINLETGRHHQIRCQLANNKTPIRGDVKYGYIANNKDASIDLHAYSIQFIHPVSKIELVIIAPPPKKGAWNNFIGII